MEQSTKEQLRELCKQEFGKITDALTEFTLKLFEEVYPTLPDIMPDQDKIKLIESVIKGQADSMVGSARAFDINQMSADVKARVNGGGYGSGRS